MVGIFAMVNSNNKNEFSKYKKILNNIKEQDTTFPERSFQQGSDNVVLFFSFDIVNSSIYKTINYYGWSIVIGKIIKELRDIVKSKIAWAEVWRVLGDEIIFIVNISDKESLHAYIDSIYSILIEYCNNIEKGDFFNNIENCSNSMIHLMKIENIISLQASAWIAAVKNKSEIKAVYDSGYVENIFEIIEESKNNKFYEFIGIDIDTGFRISKQTREKRLVLSFELAYILSETPEIVERFNIVTYRKLKGVWNNASYPIIWYYDKNKHENREFDDSFPFDAIEKDDLYAEIFDEKKFYPYMYTEINRALNKIKEDRRLDSKINHIESLINKSKESFKPYIYSPKLELHCVAVCYDEEGRILIVKRSLRELYKSKWEFGCAKANSSQELNETIVDEYEKDFGIQIQLYMDENRVDSQPVPLAIYSVDNNHEKHKGIICLARIISGNIKLNDKKHCDYKFITAQEIDSLNEEECVPDMKETLKQAFEKIRSIGGKNE